MNHKPDETQMTIALIAFVAVGLLFLLKLFVVILFLLSCVFSVLCLFALRKPYTIGKMTITTHEARAFFIGGVVGVLVFQGGGMILFGELEFYKMPELRRYLNMAGYALGALSWSMVAGYLVAAKEVPAPSMPSTATLTPPPVPQDRPNRPFVFASWDDEEKNK